MVRRFLFLVPLALALLVSAAAAAPLDKSANEKIDEAINEHYLATDFRKAEGILLGVINACNDQCSPSVIARAWMYVGLVRGSGNQDIGSATEAFGNAVAADPNVDLDQALATPETQDAFRSVKKSGGGSGSAAATPAAAGVATLDCTPAVREVETSRPIPISCDAPSGAAAVELAYRRSSDSAYTTVLFEEAGGFVTAEVPCEATSTPGELQLYVVASGAAGGVAGQWGTPDAPVIINLVEESTMAPPSLPGQPAPPRCGATGTGGIEDSGADCPPGFPGCAGAGNWGDSCTPAEPCKEGLYCEQGICEPAPACDSDSECASGVCSEGFCEMEAGGEGAAGPFKKNWVGLHVGLDIPIVVGNQLCFRDGGWNDGFRCYDSAGNGPVEDYNLWSSGRSASPLLGTTRILLSYDRFFTPKISVGARAGFAFGGGEADFQPIHAEARVAYWFVGVNDLGFNPYVFGGGGMAQVNSKVTADVCPVNLTPEQEAAGVPGCPATYQLDAYKLMGLGFVEAGAGALIKVAGSSGVLVNVGLMYMFPFPGVNIEPSVGYVVGF